MKKRKKALFVTGATGFVGSYIVQQIFKSPVYGKFPIFLLVRDLGNKKAEERITARFPGMPLFVVRGDICEETALGINKNTLAILKSFNLEVWHIAGSVEFSEMKRAEIEKINILGTKNVLEFTRNVGASRLHHMSTAYIAGKRKDLSNGRNSVAYEENLDIGQEFRNPYEESKCCGEKLVQRAAKEFGISTSVYRIGIAVGDYKSGFTPTFTGYYAYMFGLHFFREMVEKNMSRYPGVNRNGDLLTIPMQIWVSPNATINISCVDYLSRVVVRLAEKPESKGKIFHVVNPNPPTYKWLLETGFNILKIGGVLVLDSNELGVGAAPASSILEKCFNRAIKHYKDYVSGEPIFDMKNVKEVLGEIPTHPELDEDLIKKLLGYALKMNFGRISPLM